MRWRYPRTQLFVILFLLLAAWPARAIQPRQPAQDLDARTFFRPDLYVAVDNTPLRELPGDLVDQDAWSGLLAEYGPQIEVYLDPRSGVPTGLIAAIPLLPGPGDGNHLSLADLGELLGRPLREIDAGVVAEVVLRFVRDHRAALAIDPAQLSEPRVVAAADGLWQVHVPQQFQGVPVRHGRLLATIKHGNLLLLGAEVWGNVGIATTPALTADKALEIGFEHAGGRRAGDLVFDGPRLEILPAAPPAGAVSPEPGSGYRHLLAWVFTFDRLGQVGAWEVAVDAMSGEPLSFQDTHQHLDRNVRGGIYPMTNTEVCPVAAHGLFDPTRCGILQSTSTGAIRRNFGPYPMPWTDTGIATDPFTNGAGNYDWPLSATATTTLSGLYSRINDACGVLGESSATGNLDLGGTNGDHDCTAAGTSPGNTAAARTVFAAANAIAAIGRGWLPANPWLQSQVVANTNVNASCGAFWNGVSLNLFRGSSVCGNPGEILDVTSHEWGHGLDDNDANGTISNSSEGYADVAAIYRSQNSCIGYGFFRPGSGVCGPTLDGTGDNVNEAQAGAPYCAIDCSGVREADWAQQVAGVPATPQNFVCSRCLSSSGPCGRQVHCAASPIRQAAWDLAARDLQALPYGYDTDNAFWVASRLFYQGSGNVGLWYSCNCGAGTSDGCNAGSGYLQWLAADDDNANLFDGTPHATALHGAFDRHGIACPAPAPLRNGCFGAPAQRPEVTLAVDATSVALAWPAVAGASEYWVLRSEGVAGCQSGKAPIATVAGTTYTDHEVMPGHPYCYVVVPVGSSDACFGPSSVCTCTTPKACKQPGNQRLLAVDFSAGIPANWTVVDGGSGGGAAATWTTANPCGLAIASPFSSPWAAVNSACAGLGASQDEQLITPNIALLRAGCQQVSLSFDSQFAWNGGGGKEIADVDVTLDGGATWFNVLRQENHAEGMPSPRRFKLDLTHRTLGQGPLKIRFHYYDAGGDGWWAVDNVDVVCECPGSIFESPSPVPFPQEPAGPPLGSSAGPLLRH